MIAAGAIVDEADGLISKLTVLQDAVGHHAPKVAGARNKDTLQADAGAPPAFQQLPHRFARGVGKDDIEAKKQRPDELRHFVRAAGFRLFGRVVRLHVQGGDHAQDDGQDAADEDGKEIVDARAAAAEPVGALDLKGERRQDSDKRQHVQVLLNRRIAPRHRDEPALESDAVRQHERPHRQHRVGEDVKDDEQAIVASYHRVPAGAAIVSSTTSRICCTWRSRENRCVYRLMRAESNG